MSKHARVSGLGAMVSALAVTVVASLGGNAADDDDGPNPEAKAVRQAVAKLAGDIEKNGSPRPIPKQLKDVELEHVMRVFKLRDRGGLGFGQAGMHKPDGIEAQLFWWARKPLSKADLMKKREDIARAAYVAAAVAQVAEDHPIGKQAPKEWKGWTKDMSRHALALAKAAEAGDPKAVKEHATALNRTCSKCHATCCKDE